MIRQVLLLGALALAFGVAVRVVTEPAPAVATAAPPATETPEVKGDGRPRWQEFWTRPAPGLAAMDLSPDGATVAWADGKGAVRRLDADGRTLWQKPPSAGVNRLIATPGGSILAYRWLNPARPEVQILSGASTRSCLVDGAIWDVAISADGGRMVVGTGQRSIYVFPTVTAETSGVSPKARWRTPGIPASVAVTSEEPMALTGTWQEAGVSAFDLKGMPRWRHDEADPTRQYDVCLSGDGSTAVGVSARAPRETEARLHAWDAGTGRPLWAQDLDAFHPEVLTSRQGRFVAVTYVKMLSYHTGQVVERKVALYDRQGKRLWEKGGLFFSPRLVALSADGARLTVTDGASTLYTLDVRGRIVSRLRLSPHPKTGVMPVIKEAVASEDGKYLLLRRGDDRISLLKAT